jgi:predicted transcriptional regulator with HTH domain
MLSIRIYQILYHLYNFTWKIKNRTFLHEIKGYPIVTPWKTIHEDFAALVYGGYMTETEKDGIKYYHLTEAGIQAGRW